MPTPRPQRRKPPARPQAPVNRSRTPAIYILVVSLVVFSLVLAALSTVDWSGVLGGSEEPTPDYNVDSISVQQTMVAQNPDDVAARALLASMLANSRRMTEAIPIYEAILKDDPVNAIVRLDFARGLQANGFPADAEAQFLRVLELQPENHSAHYYLARLYMDWQPRRQEEAIAHFQRVIEIAPDSFLAEQAQSVLDTAGKATPVASPSLGG